MRNDLRHPCSRVEQIGVSLPPEANFVTAGQEVARIEMSLASFQASTSKGIEKWYSWVGSNHRPPVPQTGALTN